MLCVLDTYLCMRRAFLAGLSNKVFPRLLSRATLPHRNTSPAPDDGRNNPGEREKIPKQISAPFLATSPPPLPVFQLSWIFLLLEHAGGISRRGHVDFEVVLLSCSTRRGRFSCLA